MLPIYDMKIKIYDERITVVILQEWSIAFYDITDLENT